MWSNASDRVLLSNRVTSQATEVHARVEKEISIDNMAKKKKKNKKKIKKNIKTQPENFISLSILMLTFGLHEVCRIRQLFVALAAKV